MACGRGQRLRHQTPTPIPHQQSRLDRHPSQENNSKTACCLYVDTSGLPWPPKLSQVRQLPFFDVNRGKIYDSICNSTCDSICDSTVGSDPLTIVSTSFQFHFGSLCADAHRQTLVYIYIYIYICIGVYMYIRVYMYICMRV